MLLVARVVHTHAQSRHGFCFLYAHDERHGAWLLYQVVWKLFRLFPPHVTRALASLLVLRGSTGAKLFFAGLSPALGGGFGDRVAFVDAVPDLWNFVAREQVDLPAAVLADDDEAADAGP